MRVGWLRRDHLYGALLWNVLPPIIVLILMVGFVLSLVYVSAIFGGQAWIESSVNGAVPQVFKFVEEESFRCLHEGDGLKSSSCMSSRQLSGVPASPGAVIVRADLQERALRLFDVEVEAEVFSSSLKSQKTVSGFSVFGGRLVHVSKLAGKEYLLVRDVTDSVLYRVSRAGAVEVEVFEDDDASVPVATTFRGYDGEELLSRGEGPAEDMVYRRLVFDKPYRGYRSELDGGEQYLYSGMTEFESFARSYRPAAVDGAARALLVISVPEQVMLGYTVWMIYASVLLAALILLLTFVLLRRLTFQQIQPIVKVASRIRALNSEIQSGAHEMPEETSSPTELESLQYAVTLLEETLKANRMLEQRVRQTERLEAIGRLTGGIAHDFNNLLGVVKANCAFLEEDISDPGLLESVEEIAAAASRGAEMTASLLAFSSGRASKVDVGRDIALEVRSIMSLLSRSIGAEVEVSLDIESPAVASLSGAQLQQVLLNLVFNARDAIRGSRVHIHVALEAASRVSSQRSRDVPDDWWCLSVKDDGVGMSEEVMRHIFEPFYTNKAFSSEHGTGLGLSVVYGIVESAGGFIDVQSVEGEGTSFFIYLPQAQWVSGESMETRVESGLNPMQVLLVEDDESVRRSVRTMLVRMGLSVIDFESGLQVRDWLEETSLDDINVLVTDVRMPQMDGYELATLCRGSAPTLPVLFMTGYDADAATREDVPHSRLLMKPLSSEALQGALHSLSKHSRRGSELG